MTIILYQLVFIRVTADALTSAAGNTHGLVFEATGLGVGHGGFGSHQFLMWSQAVNALAVVYGMMATVRHKRRAFEESSRRRTLWLIAERCRRRKQMFEAERIA